MTVTQARSFARHEDAPVLPPPAGTVGVRGWLRKNLFPGWGNGLLTIVLGLLLAIIAWTIIDWALIRAVWTGQDREACAIEGAGACWPFVVGKIPAMAVRLLPGGGALATSTRLPDRGRRLHSDVDAERSLQEVECAVPRRGISGDRADPALRREFQHLARRAMRCCCCWRCWRACCCPWPRWGSRTGSRATARARCWRCWGFFRRCSGSSPRPWRR